MALIDQNPSGTLIPGDDEKSDFFTPQRIRLMAIGAGVVAVVAIGIWFVSAAGNRKEAFAAQALESARMTAEQGNIGEAVQQFEAITTQYEGTAAGYEAALGMAQARLVAGQAELAIASLEEFLASNPPAGYGSPAQGLLGTALENTTRWVEAESAYVKAADLATVDFLKATFLLDAGRAAGLAGNVDGAKAHYQRIVDDFGGTAVLSEAEVRLAELTATASI